jgi:hypothetical protein
VFLFVELYAGTIPRTRPSSSVEVFVHENKVDNYLKFVGLYVCLKLGCKSI